MKTIGTLFVLCCVSLATNAASHNRLAQNAEKAAPAEFPYLVSIQVDGRHSCGGALISKSHVLTAAHCIKRIVYHPEPSATKASRLTVEVGSTVIGQGQKHKVKRLSFKKGFSDSLTQTYFMPNDIAIITLKTPVTESANVKIISLPGASSQIPVGSKVVVPGFGNAKVDAPTSHVLQKADFNIVTQAECNQYYTAATGLAITSAHLCAKKGFGDGTCQGDSGGPLVHNNVVVGIVSGGNGNCGGGDPDVYTKVSSHIPYIQYEMNYDSTQGNDESGPSVALNLDDPNSQAPQLPQDAVGQLPGQYPGGLLPPGSFPQGPLIPYPPGLVPQYPGLFPYPPVDGILQGPPIQYPPGLIPQIPIIPGYPIWSPQYPVIQYAYQQDSKY